MKALHLFITNADSQDRIEDDIGSTASSSSHESELNQLDEAINQIKNTNFNAEALISKLKKRYSDDAKLSHKVKMKIHCLLELLEDFDCYDELLKNTAWSNLWTRTNYWQTVVKVMDTEEI